MPVYTWQGNSASGEKVQGERAAENKQVLRAALARERIQANVIKEKGGAKSWNLNFQIGGGSVKAKELAIFFRQFSVMIDAGLPLVQCMEILGLVVGALLKFVVPIFANLFVGLGVALPAPTRFVINLSAFIQSFWWLIFLTIGLLVVAIKYIRKTPEGLFQTDKIMLNLPVFGQVLRKIAVARFTRTLGTLISSGVPILDGLSITARTSGNAVLERALMKVRTAIESGRTIVDPLRESGVFPNMVTQMIGVGEATGAMDSMLQKIADFYEDEVDAATKDMLALMEPMLISFLGVAVGGIVISLYLPLFSMIAKLAG